MFFFVVKVIIQLLLNLDPRKERAIDYEWGLYGSSKKSFSWETDEDDISASDN